MNLRCLIIPVVFLLFAHETIAQAHYEVDYASLKGKVRSVQEKSFAAKGRGTNIRKGKPRREYNIQHDYIVEYDVVGNKISYAAHNVKSSAVQYRVSYQYDSLGLVKAIINHRGDACKADTTICVNQYNSEGKPIRRMMYLPREKKPVEFIYTYDATGTATATYKLQDSDSSDPKYSAVYDKNWRVLKSWVYSMQHKILFTIHHRYDSAGRKIEEQWNNSDDKPVLYYRWKYDANDNLERREVCGTSGKSCEAWTYKYEFDEMGNWVKAIEYRNGKPVFIKERTITYY